MANSKGPSRTGDVLCSGKNSLLPPKSPYTSISPSYIEYIPPIMQKGLPKPREGNSHHQRTSSESFLMDEQPSWLDDLLNEPDSPVHKGGHRRSSSDSFASFANSGYIVQGHNKFPNMLPIPSWGPQFDYHGDGYGSGIHRSRTKDISPNKITHPSGIPSPREIVAHQKSESSYSPQESNMGNVNLDVLESHPNGTNSSVENESSEAKISASETDMKRAKQQFAQRSRVRKLQYIAELERIVHSLQVGGFEASAQLEFMNQQNLILSMENKALKQRLESLAQEHLIKYLEHEVLEREKGRLQTLYHQQLQTLAQPKKRPYSGHRLTKSVDFGKQFANLSLE
ncbi:unnamed protein product [Cuscuta campestris]|uniref:BZIP domain-containing protein n=2 Tax=Cuscuta sect. Cleistogrammica TaxID=1824901 RepID=A0A484N8W0_9ASTE|nr:hypothetical protein DM860_003690 [Cuscuta australis]VFQ96294.1 unnamed protein product [Cuscuta campestris]